MSVVDSDFQTTDVKSRISLPQYHVLLYQLFTLHLYLLYLVLVLGFVLEKKQIINMCRIFRRQFSALHHLLNINYFNEGSQAINARQKLIKA